MPRLDPGGLSGAFRRKRAKASLDFLVPEREPERAAPQAPSPAQAPQAPSAAQAPEPEQAPKRSRKRAAKAAPQAGAKPARQRSAAPKPKPKQAAKPKPKRAPRRKPKQEDSETLPSGLAPTAEAPQSKREPERPEPSAALARLASGALRRHPGPTQAPSSAWTRPARKAPPATRAEWFAPGTPTWPRPRSLSAWALRRAERLVGRLLRSV